MATKAKMEKSKKTLKFAVRQSNRCPLCGRSRAYFRKFDMCRMCLRKLAHRGMLPGVTKASW